MEIKIERGDERERDIERERGWKMIETDRSRKNGTQR